MVSAVVAANYLKIAGVSIFAFDYLQTLPAEIRFYRRQKGIFRLSMACWLLIFVRYLGMTAILLSMVGGFSTTFTKETCDNYFLTVPVFKVLAAVASQGVFIFRTYAICSKDRKILWFLLIFGGLLSVAEIVAPVVVPRNSKLGVSGNCISDLSKGSTSWIQYLCQVIFDVVILGLTFDRLFRGVDMRFVTRSEFTMIFWESQVMYFIAVTVMNILNLIFFIKFNKSSESTMFATLGMAITAIFSSHVILDLHEASRNPRSYSLTVPHQNATGIHTMTFRNGEVVERQFRVVDPEVAKTEAFRMDNLDIASNSGILVQREVVAMVDSDQSSVHTWDKRKSSGDVKKQTI